MNLFFLASNGEKRLVKENIQLEENADAVTSKVVSQEIRKYVAALNPNYKIYYTRSWYSSEEKGTMYDIGSHTEFFLLTD